MRMLKGLVIVMTLLLVGGVAMLGYGLSNRVGRSAAAVGDGTFGTLGLDLPPGASVEQMVVADGRVVLRLSGPDGQQRLIMLDPATGRHLGTVLLGARP
ncbi:MAG: hypothetical protein HQL41_05010 [Alphaproteobacteria bacterium]|nr:hypothetical protein [Alphaproteobacteria bacterium]